MNAVFFATACLLPPAAASAAEPAVPPQDLAEDSPLRSDRPAGWREELVGAVRVLRYETGKEGTLKLPPTRTEDLVAEIAKVGAGGPRLEKILLGRHLTRCTALQMYLRMWCEEKHPLSLLKESPQGLGANPSRMPIQGEENAQPLGPIALNYLKQSPDVKLVSAALEAVGLRIKDITWDEFHLVAGPGEPVFDGVVTLHLEAAVVK